MAVKHAFNNPKADGADATIARPSDWNAAHTIDPATITLAMNVNVSATQRVIGRNTAGAGVQEEVTASQLLDWASNTNGVLLTRTAGTWGALANVTTDNGDLQFAENASPVAPAAGKSKVFGSSHGGRQMPAFMGAVGAKSFAQPLVGNRHIAQVITAPATASFSQLGLSLTNVGITARGITSTNLFTGTRRAAIVSAAGAGSVASSRHGAALLWRGNAAGAGGFHFICRFGISDAVIVATANMFVGVQANTAAPTDVDPASLANLLGVGCTSGDTVLQLYAADATPRARTSLGANFPVNTINTDLYELALFCPPNGSDVRYQVTRLNTGDVATGTISAAANLPLGATTLTYNVYRSNGGTAAAVGLDIGTMYLESDS